MNNNIIVKSRRCSKLKQIVSVHPKHSKRLTNYVGESRERERWTTKPPPLDIVGHLLFRHILNCEGFGTNRQCNALIVSNDINICIMCYYNCSGSERLHRTYNNIIFVSRRCPKRAYVVGLINYGGYIVVLAGTLLL